VQVIKNTQQSAIQESATTTTRAIQTKEGRRRRGAGQGNNEVEEDYDQRACDHHLNATNARAGGGWRATAVNGGVGGGCQRATADADEALSTRREVTIK
jgi:hypothetical protein